MSFCKDNHSVLSGDAPKGEPGIFGLHTTEDEAKLVILSLPWEPTASFGRGTSEAPQKILPESHQLDLEDLYFGRPYEKGIVLLKAEEKILAMNREAIELVEKFRKVKSKEEHPEEIQARVNRMSEEINEYLEEKALGQLQKDKLIGLLGGDHSCPFGLIKALGKHYGEFGILHIDAHYDLRKAYEGFTYSHASIFRNVLEQIPQVTCLSSAGIRDFSREEKAFADSLGRRYHSFLDRDLFRMKASGKKFHEIAHAMIEPLPQHVYISFDIDGLDQTFCPNTGTPVPGGLSFNEANYLLETLCESKRKVIGFDLCEVGNQPWDLNVGARVLYKLCGTILK